MRDQPTPAHTLLARFPGIRMRLHADRLGAQDQGLSRHVITDRQQLGALFTSTKATSKQVDVSLAAPNGYPLRVAELAARLDELRPSTRLPFDQAFESFRSHHAPIELEIPAFGLENGEYLLLDGNHRAVGLFRSGRPFTLRLCALEAPINRRYLIDLKYWDRPGLAGVVRATGRWKRAIALAIASAAILAAYASEWPALLG